MFLVDFSVDSDPGPLMVKLNVKESKNSQKRAMDKKPKSKYLLFTVFLIAASFLVYVKSRHQICCF